MTILALLAAALTFQSLQARAAEVTLTETGSTLMLPLLRSWAAAYATLDADVRIVTAGTNSGAGIAAAEAGSAQLGASDAYMSDIDLMNHPGVLNIPLAISAQLISYNISSLPAPLKLSGPVLAGIYGGSIQKWNAPEIAALNPGITLPANAIVPIRRSDSAGDTFIFTQFLSFSTPSWETGPGFGTTVKWPNVSASATAAGNEGMVQALQQTPFSIAYVGGSFGDEIAAAKLGTAMLLNDGGQYVQATPETVAAAAAALTPRTPPDERLTLAFAPGADSYPLINYEYAVVRTKQASPEQAAALRNFLTWTLTPGQGTNPSYLDPVHFIALPTSIRALSELQVAKIQ